MPKAGFGWTMPVLAAASIATSAAAAPPQAGTRSLLVLQHSSTNSDSRGSTGSSGGTDTIQERVIAVRDGGLELEYDFPPDSTARERDADWHLPARVKRSADGSVMLLNRTELEKRIDPWLARAGWNRNVCGHWIFTWTAFKIDCDPNSVLDTMKNFDIGHVAWREGATYSFPGTLTPAPLERIANKAGGSTFRVQLQIDPDSVRREMIESDLVVAQITGEALSREEATARHADEKISGSVVITLLTDSAGYTHRRIAVTKVRTESGNGQWEETESTSTLTRQPIRLPANAI